MGPAGRRNKPADPGSIRAGGGMQARRVLRAGHRQPLYREGTMPKSKSNNPDAIELLKQDHASVKKSFKEFEKMDHGDTATLQELVTMVCNELKVHTSIEEEIFYPAVRKAIEDEDIMNEAKVEHQSAKDLITQLEAMKADDPLYPATFTVLCEYVLHHVKEEESEMFPQVKKTQLDLDALGRQMLARKEELMASA
jgi:hemerythrin superfamily protein